MTTQLELVAVWLAALDTPYGLVVQTAGLEAARQALYKARQAAKDPRLDGLSLRVWTDGPDQLAIVKVHPAGAPAPPRVKLPPARVSQARALAEIENLLPED